MFNLYPHLAPPAGPSVVRLDQLEQAARMAAGFTLAGAAHTLRHATPHLGFLNMYQQLMPELWRKSKANLLRDQSPHSQRSGYFSYFSEREMEFFEHVDQRLVPLEVELYGEAETDDPYEQKYVELLIDWKGWGDADVDEDDLDDEGQEEMSDAVVYPGIFLLRATASAWVCDGPWVNVCHKLGLEAVRDMPHFLKHTIAEHYHSLTYDTAKLFPALQALGPKWQRIEEIWEYAAGRARSDILTLRARDFGYRQLQYPEFTLEELQLWAGDWEYGRPLISAFDRLAEELAAHPALVRRYLRLLAEHTRLSDTPSTEPGEDEYELHSFSADSGDPMVESYEFNQFDRLERRARGRLPKIWPEYSAIRVRSPKVIFQ